MDVPPGGDPRTIFHQRYRAVFGHLPGEREAEWVFLRVVMAEQTASTDAFAADPATAEASPAPPAHQRCRLDGAWREVPSSTGAPWPSAGPSTARR
ncbi:MAG: hypothetical protein Q9Q13_04370 [Acidobacteriota bacterium]|nr:hypothetical protein [Acidobacteriota bacterium]